MKSAAGAGAVPLLQESWLWARRLRSECGLQLSAADRLCLTLVSMSLTTSLMRLHNHSSPPHPFIPNPTSPPSPPQLVCLSFSAGGLQFQRNVGAWVCVPVLVCARAQPVVWSLSAFRWMCKCDNWVFQVQAATVSLTHTHVHWCTPTQTSHSLFVSE